MGEDFFKNTLDNLNLAVCVLDKDKQITYWNSGAEKLTGFKSSEVLGKHFKLSRDEDSISQAIADGNAREAEASIYCNSGKKIQVSYHIIPNKDSDKKIIGTTVMFHDISMNLELVKRLKELQQIASVDFLTKLPNRRMFERNVLSKFEEMNRCNRPFGIIFMDIDNFKMINDNYGHEVGDLVLKMVSKKLSEMVRPYDVVGRWGGEEFVALIPNVGREQLYAVASRIRTMIERTSVFTGDSVVKVTLSVGAAIARAEDTVDSLVKRADSLMYASKKAGKNRVTIEVTIR